jgi:hypothetical protein
MTREWQGPRTEIGGEPHGSRREPAESHITRVVVWDVPSAVECGAVFRVRVGVKCVHECRAGEWVVELCDEVGRSLAQTAMSDAPWPGTAALFHAEVQLRAPATEGLHAWEARVAAVDGDGRDDAGHGASTTQFNVRAVPAPECLLKVIAVDAQTRSPVEGAQVVLHPYRASTGGDGVAELKVPKGEYRLFVSGRNYLPFRSDGEVAADVTITAELEADVGISDAELWP